MSEAKSDDNQTQVPESKPEASKPAASQPAHQAPSIDKDAIAKEVVNELAPKLSETISETTKNQIQDAFKAIAGVQEEKEPELHQGHKTFAQDYEGWEEEVLSKAEQRIEQKRAAYQGQMQELSRIVTPIFEDCPDLAKAPEVMEAEIRKVYESNPNLSRDEIVQKGAANARERLGFKVLSEEEKKEAYRNARLPGASGMQVTGDAPVRTPQQSALDYVENLKKQAAAVRRGKAAA